MCYWAQFQRSPALHCTHHVTAHSALRLLPKPPLLLCVSVKRGKEEDGRGHLLNNNLGWPLCVTASFYFIWVIGLFWVEQTKNDLTNCVESSVCTARYGTRLFICAIFHSLRIYRFCTDTEQADLRSRMADKNIIADFSKACKITWLEVFWFATRQRVWNGTQQKKLWLSFTINMTFCQYRIVESKYYKFEPLPNLTTTSTHMLWN